MNRKLIRIFEPSVALCFLVMFLFAVVSFLFNMPLLSAIESGVTLVLLVVYIIFTKRKQHELLQYLNSASDSRDLALRSGVPFPMAVIQVDREEIIWANSQFLEVTKAGNNFLFKSKIRDLIPVFSTKWLIDGKQECPDEVVIDSRRYRMTGNLFRPGASGISPLMASVYLLDLTEMLDVRDEYVNSRPIICLLLVDNYDELVNNLPEDAVSVLNVRINKKVTSFLKGLDCLYRKIERNRHLVLFEARHLSQLIENKFSILEDIHTITNPSGMVATMSIGIGKDGANFDESYSFAALSVEMALSRGGDQAVVKDRYDFSFYGGRAKESERYTPVKSRVFANSLSELIQQSSQVFVMGHKNADLDTIGSAVGIFCLCRRNGKHAKIVVDMKKNFAKSLISQLRELDAYDEAFVSGEDALLACDPRSLLVVVDTNRPDQVESLPLLESISRVVVIDHHRRAADFIEQVVLMLHEPYVSSAAELVTEVLKYAVDPSDVLPLEAQALLAGIVLDTKNFSLRTNAGTFEAAALLRRLGADPVDVKKLFQSDLQSVLSRYQILQAARLYRGEIAVAALDYTTSRAIAAQAADELLGISGISASFVLYPEENHITISARSLGDINVQGILEPLGGGGNGTTAGAQISGRDVTAVLTNLVASIDKTYEA